MRVTGGMGSNQSVYLLLQSRHSFVKVCTLIGGQHLGLFIVISFLFQESFWCMGYRFVPHQHGVSHNYYVSLLLIYALFATCNFNFFSPYYFRLRFSPQLNFDYLVIYIIRPSAAFQVPIEQTNALKKASIRIILLQVSRYKGVNWPKYLFIKFPFLQIHFYHSLSISFQNDTSITYLGYRRKRKIFL